jgi:methanogenic corrinoid protein MtbC1
LVAISIATPLNLAKTKQLIAEIKSLPVEQTPSIIMGGAALNARSDLWKYLGADAVASDLSEGIEIANQLVASRPAKALERA